MLKPYLLSSTLFALVAAGCGSSPASPDGSADGGAGTFQLAWEDNFDSFDSSRWALQTHTWDGNLAQFSTANTRSSGRRR